MAKGTVEYIERFNEFTLQQVVYFAWALGRLSGITSVRSDPEVREKGRGEEIGKSIRKQQLIPCSAKVPRLWRTR